jgi:Fe-S cluster assembly protein SufD
VTLQLLVWVLEKKKPLFVTIPFLFLIKKSLVKVAIIKNALKNGAKAIFQGKIFVDSKAQKTDGYQMSNGLILSDDCEFLVKPELEIYADDVVCSHGSISGTLNEDHLFYLRSRGIPLNEAQKKLIQAFYSEILDEVSEDNIVYYIQNQISEMITL